MSSLSVYSLWFVMCPDLFVDFVAIYCSFAYLIFLLSALVIYSLTYLLPYLYNSLRMRLFHFQAGRCKRQPNLALVFLFILCCSIFCYGCIFAFVVFVFVFQY